MVTLNAWSPHINYLLSLINVVKIQLHTHTDTCLNLELQVRGWRKFVEINLPFNVKPCSTKWPTYLNAVIVEGAFPNVHMKEGGARFGRDEAWFIRATPRYWGCRNILPSVKDRINICNMWKASSLQRDSYTCAMKPNSSETFCRNILPSVKTGGKNSRCDRVHLRKICIIFHLLTARRELTKWRVYEMIGGASLLTPKRHSVQWSLIHQGNAAERYCLSWFVIFIVVVKGGLCSKSLSYFSLTWRLS